MRPFAPAWREDEILSPAGEFRVGAEVYRVELGAGRVVATSAEFERIHTIEQMIGGRDVVYFLTALERGRLQVLPMGYDVHRKEWFDVASSTVRHFDVADAAPVDWRAPAYTFNASCYGCHVSHGWHQYDPVQDRLQSSWKEPGISCETCHGPAEEHVQLSRSLAPGTRLTDWRIASLRGLPAEQVDSLCGTCHGKLTPLTGGYTPGERLLDHFDIVGLEDLDFGADGRDRGENYTMAGWRMNRCAREGAMSCLHCHTSSGRYRFAETNPNAACLPCHEERVVNATAHTRHAAGSPGNDCVACHMPRHEFARMVRHDHSFRPPMPALTMSQGSPNACNDCHGDRDPAWADALVRDWHGHDYQAPVLYAAGLIAEARRQDWRRMTEMSTWLGKRPREELFATSLIRLWANTDDDRKWPALIEALTDPSPLVRSSAARGLHGYPGAKAAAGLKPLLKDDYRVVRIQAAASLARVAAAELTESERAAFESAAEEFEAAMRVRGDDPAAFHELGHFRLDREDIVGAIVSFEHSLRLRPGHLETLISAATAYYRNGELDKAGACLRQAIAVAPEANAAQFNLGILLEVQGKLEDAEDAYRRTLQLDPGHKEATRRLAELAR